jgi:hypothetical protein
VSRLRVALWAACACVAAACAAVLPAGAAYAEDREFCADRPGLGTPACTLAPGDAMVEIGLAAWDRDRSRSAIEDDITLGDVLVRVGVGDTTEVHLGLTGNVRQRFRNRASGAVRRLSGIGDATLAVRQGLAGANGPVAVQAFVTVPLAKDELGAGGWSGGVLAPVNLDLPGELELDLTPEVDLVPNADRGGRHLAWGGVVGLSHPLGETLSLSGEIGVFRDDDPDGHSTDARFAAALAWQLAERVQVDVEADAGLSVAAPDRTLALGLAWRF